MRRRTFIVGSVATVTVAAAAIAIPVAYKKYQDAKWDRPLIRPVILSNFCDEETIRNIGLAYRSKFPAENSERKLIDLLVPANAGKIQTSSDNSVDGSQFIGKIQQEFKDNNILNLNGWVLSPTEARQCALLSLT